MKKVFLFAGVLFLAACGNQEGDVVQSNEATATIRKAMVPNIEGVWVMKDFVSKMESTQSPKAASDVLEGVVGLNINQESVRTDSMEGGVNWNNHEGSGFSIYFKKGIADSSLKISLTDENGFYELGFVRPELVLYHYDKTNKLLDKRIFTKVLRKQLNSDMSFGIQYIVNKKLLEGKYTGTDSLNKKAEVELSVDGKMKGLGDFKYYLAATDFMDAYSNLDYITFIKDENTSEAFGYTSKNDTLQLYTIKNNAADGTISYAKLRYILTKKP